MPAWTWTLRAPSSGAGGFYEVAFELGSRDDERLARAISAAWSHPAVEGPVIRSDNPKARVEPSIASHNGSGHLAGEVLLPGIGRTACGSVLIREESPPYADWLDFYLPIGALEELDPRTESLWNSDSTVPYEWRAPIDGFLMDVAERVAAASGFALGLIGWEVSGTLYAAELEKPPQPRKHVMLLVDAEAGSFTRISGLR